MPYKDRAVRKEYMRQYEQRRKFRSALERGKPQWRKRRIEWMRSLKSVPCMDCGGVFPPVCMDFDHVRGVKRYNISWAKERSLSELLEEIAKCEIVCSNCHRIRTHERRKK